MGCLSPVFLPRNSRPLDCSAGSCCALALNYFSHTGSLGRNPFQRMAALGCSYTPAGENIAAGYSDAQSALTPSQNACDARAARVRPDSR